MSTHVDYGYRIRSAERQVIVLRSLKRELRLVRSERDRSEIRQMIDQLEKRINARKRLTAAALAALDG